MATHSSILAWKTPRTEEPVTDRGYKSMGLQRVRHSLVTEKQQFQGCQFSHYPVLSNSLNEHFLNGYFIRHC